jgi:hypothetical protein
MNEAAMNPGPMSQGQRIALGGAVLLAVGLAGYGAVGSYETVARLAAEAGVPLPGLVLLGLDGGLVGVLVLDLVLAWTGQPVGWLRQIARLLTVGTVAANVSAGWPDPVAAGLHGAAPLMLLVMVEAGRSVLLRRAGLASGVVRDRIPFGRWILAPWRTWLLWRRMVMWQFTSYRAALDMEMHLRRIIIILRMRYGRRWKTEAPADLVWILRTGILTAEASACISKLIESVDLPIVSVLAIDESADDTVQQVQGREAAASEAEMERRQFEDVVVINKRHWERYGRPVSAETVRKQLRVGSGRARSLTRAVRAAQAAAT